MSRPDLAPGARATLTYAVREADLASALSLEPGEAYPAVFATSRMIALMELAAARVLRPLLGPGELSVGVTVEVSHSAATPPGGRVTVTGTFLRQEGKLYVFEVGASDDAGEIGRGTHRRAIVSTERILAGAAKRVPCAAR